MGPVRLVTSRGRPQSLKQGFRRATFCTTDVFDSLGWSCQLSYKGLSVLLANQSFILIFGAVVGINPHYDVFSFLLSDLYKLPTSRLTSLPVCLAGCRNEHPALALGPPPTGTGLPVRGCWPALSWEPLSMADGMDSKLTEFLKVTMCPLG